MSRYFVRILDFDRVEGVRTVDDEVNFDTGFRAPEMEGVLAAAVVVPRREMLEDESLKTRAVDFARTIQRSLRTQGAIDARISRRFVTFRSETVSAFGN